MRATPITTHRRALSPLLAMLCALALPAAHAAIASDNAENRYAPLKRFDSELAAPVSLADASPEAVLRSFVAATVGRWGADCSALVSSFKLEGGRLLGETYFNGNLGSRSAIRLASVKYAGMSNGLHRFEYQVDSRGMAQGESFSNRVIVETDLRSVRRSVYSEQLGNQKVLIRDGILLSSNTAMPMQGRCS